jgi:hypothetical protein
VIGSDCVLVAAASHSMPDGEAKLALGKDKLGGAAYWV